MANIKISDLTAASVAADANEFEINEAGTSKKVTGSQIKAYVNSGDGALASKNTVATADIDNLAVTTAKLAADAVDGTKIADDAIGNEHIATDAVNADSIAANAVGASELNVPGNGTAGQYLASDGDGTMTWTTLSAGGGFSSMQVFNSPGTWTNPGNVEKVKVTVVGGGGGGAWGSNNGTVGGPGGGAGGTAIEVISIPTATNVPVTRGNPGAGSNSAGVSGTGGTSSFGAYCSATGGTGGYSPPSNFISNAYAGSGGNGSGGNLNIRGGAGQQFFFTAPAGNIRVGGNGGDSYLAGGGKASYPDNVAAGGTGQTGQYGSGGGGGSGSNPSTQENGEAGGAGVVIVEY